MKRSLRISKNLYGNLRQIGVLAVALLCSPNAIAQTAEWSVPPTYTHLTPYNGNAYKYYSGSQVGLLDLSGHVVFQAQYDSITDFTAGYALALKNEGANYLLRGIIRQQAQQYVMQQVTEPYYVTRYHAYFSEEKMAVCNKDGVFGFIDTSGHLVIPFAFSTAHPFFDGRASVKRVGNKQNVFYINSSGKVMQVEPGDGAILFGTSFSDGEAVVFTMGRKGFVINPQGRTLRSYQGDVNEVLKSLNRRDYTIPGKEHKSFFAATSVSVPSDRVEARWEGGLYGYQNGSQTVLPPQFEQAENFKGGYALVRKDGKLGFLKLIWGGFSGQMNASSVEIHNTMGAPLTYTVSVPSGMDSDALNLKISANGRDYDLSDKTVASAGIAFTFTPKALNREKSQQLDITLKSKDLVLWQTRQQLEFTYPVLIKLGEPLASQDRAGEDDKFPLQVYVENASSTAQTLTATFHVEGYGKYSVQMTIGANSTERGTVLVPGIKEERMSKVYVTLSNGLKSRTVEIPIKPFY
ncbi:MAG: WG repeat-containing protein [Bacteroidales bacterium]|nr:WG repeat-containing protein [Bacteroidales bacterium]